MPLQSYTMQKIFTTILVSLVIFNIHVYGQESKWVITGRVMEQQTREALDFANVLLYNSNDSTLVKYTTTDIEGVFKIEHDKSGGKTMVRL